jgi:hypothetical protein
VDWVLFLVESVSGIYFIANSHLLSYLDLMFDCRICQHRFVDNASKAYHESLCCLKCSPSSQFPCSYCGITFAEKHFLLLVDHKSRCSLNHSMQSAICDHAAKMDNSVVVFGVLKYSKLNSRSLVEDDKLGRAELMKKLNQASFCGVDNHQEDRLSQKMIFKAPGKTAMSDVDVDKMASAALSRKHNCSYQSVPLAKHFIDNFPLICDCVYLPDYCVHCISHSESNEASHTIVAGSQWMIAVVLTESNFCFTLIVYCYC